MCNATRGIDAGRRVIRHRGVSDGSDGARPLWQSHSAQTEMFFADGEPPFLVLEFVGTVNYIYLMKEI